MTPEEYEEVRHTVATKALFTASELVGQKPRTLIYGYNVDRETWHVYWDGEEIIRHIYIPNKTILREAHSPGLESGVWDILDLVPNKRVYWEASDGWFCRQLILRGAYISFTSRKRWEDSDFIGEL